MNRRTFLWGIAAPLAVIIVGLLTYNGIAARSSSEPAAVDSHGHAATAHAAEAASHSESATSSHDHGGEPVQTHDPGHGHGQESGEAEGSAHAGEGHEGEAHADEVTLTTESVVQSGIKVGKVEKHVLKEDISIPGRVSYNTERMAHVGTSVPGRIVEVRAKLGDTVRKGDVLFVLDSAVLGETQAEFLQKQTDVTVATTSVEIAQAAFERVKKLVASSAVPGSEFQLREGELKKANGGLQTAQAALRSVESKLHLYGIDHVGMEALTKAGEINSRLTIVAPIDGTVIEREATIGEIVNPERDALLVLADMTTLWVLADVPEGQLSKVAIGTSATVTVEALNNASIDGHVAYVAPEVNSETRTAQVRIELHDGHVLRPGMFAKVKLAYSPGGKQAAAVLCVPETAVHTFEGGPVVFLQSPEGPTTFVSRPVKVGEAVGEMIPVLSGVEEGAPIVVAGNFIIKAEMAKGIMEGKTCSGH